VTTAGLDARRWALNHAGIALCILAVSMAFACSLTLGAALARAEVAYSARSQLHSRNYLFIRIEVYQIV
jgi:hypothetical protein